MSGRELRSLYQNMLNVLVALLGNGRSQHLVGRALLGSAQPAITDCLFDRPETSNIADLDSPGQSGDRTNSGNRSNRFSLSMSSGSRSSELTSA